MRAYLDYRFQLMSLLLYHFSCPQRSLYVPEQIKVVLQDNLGICGQFFFISSDRVSHYFCRTEFMHMHV